MLSSYKCRLRKGRSDMDKIIKKVRKTKIITIMKHNELLKQIAVMTAYAAGNEVEYRELPNGEW